MKTKLHFGDEMRRDREIRGTVNNTLGCEMKGVMLSSVLGEAGGSEEGRGLVGRDGWRETERMVMEGK